MSAPTRDASRPHAGQPVLHAGAPLATARLAMIMVHGRGGSAEDILGLAGALGAEARDVAFLAPQAAGSTWYPQRFMAPMAQNEPWLSSALETLDRVAAQAQEAGLPAERTLFLGFSQGACLTTEWIARHARRWGGVAGLSGGLIGPEGTPRDYAGSLAGTPVFLGCSDVDMHIPVQRVHETHAVLTALGAEVTTRIYPGMPHTIVQDEIDHVRALLRAAAAA